MFPSREALRSMDCKLPPGFPSRPVGIALSLAGEATGVTLVPQNVIPNPEPCPGQDSWGFWPGQGTTFLVITFHKREGVITVIRWDATLRAITGGGSIGLLPLIHGGQDAEIIESIQKLLPTWERAGWTPSGDQHDLQ